MNKYKTKLKRRDNQLEVFKDQTASFKKISLKHFDIKKIMMDASGTICELKAKDKYTIEDFL